ncbi:MAG TPA: DUF4340 domain-containing protein [Bryobacteraceae bacterium]|nr:DUF4340 domain-containing protein [Bryobacteraceae bacterium]
MKPNGLLIAVALLAILGGLTWWSNKKQAAASKTSDTTTKILDIPGNLIQDIVLKKTAQTIELHREGVNTWKMTQPSPLPADTDAASGIVTTLGTLNADSVVDAKATDLTPYGLQNPSLDVQITESNGKHDGLMIGDETPTGSGSYAKLANDPRVFTIASYAKTNIDKSPNDLRDKRVLTFDSDKLTRVELQGKGEPIEFGKNNQGDWQILKPRPLRADGSQVDTFINALKDARMDMAEDSQKAAAAFAAAPKVGTASVTDANGNQSIEVHKDKDNNYYVKSTAVAGIYKVTGDLGKSFDKGVNDFRSKKLFEFGFSDPSLLEVQGVTYSKAGNDWTAGPKKMDNASVQTLIDKLRDLTATTFEAEPGEEKVFEATVISNQGKRTEKVTITKEGSKYFAKRQDDPSIYGLEAQAVDDLKKAASDVKEAAPPPAAKKK